MLYIAGAFEGDPNSSSQGKAFETSLISYKV